VASFEPIIQGLEAAGVRYVIVGGVAVVLHGYARLTIDLDLVVDLEPTRAATAIESLVGMGLRPEAPVSPGGFADPEVRRSWVETKGMVVFSMVDPQDPLRRVDLFTEEVIPFEQLWERSQSVDVGGTSMRVASISDLIAMKRATGRPRDLEDVAALQEILRLREVGDG
jgi:predicted nucleotidyltransferase